jgi:hypothetical protein
MATRTPPSVDILIYQGASITQLAEIFSMDTRDIKARLADWEVKPSGEKDGNAIYKIKEVAPYLTVPAYDMEEFIKKMRLSDLPMMLRKEYWASRRSQQLYEIAQAELWPTSEVSDMITDLLSTIRISLLLTRDNVERENELSPKQRSIIVSIIDTALQDTHAAITKRFSDYKAKAKAGDDPKKGSNRESDSSEDL